MIEKVLAVVVAAIALILLAAFVYDIATGLRWG